MSPIYSSSSSTCIIRSSTTSRSCRRARLSRASSSWATSRRCTSRLREPRSSQQGLVSYIHLTGSMRRGQRWGGKAEPAKVEPAKRENDAWPAKGVSQQVNDVLPPFPSFLSNFFRFLIIWRFSPRLVEFSFVHKRSGVMRHSFCWKKRNSRHGAIVKFTLEQTLRMLVLREWWKLS